jgi:hypothetical protein
MGLPIVMITVTPRYGDIIFLGRLWLVHGFDGHRVIPNNNRMTGFDLCFNIWLIGTFFYHNV